MKFIHVSFAALAALSSFLPSQVRASADLPALAQEVSQFIETLGSSRPTDDQGEPGGWSAAECESLARFNKALFEIDAESYRQVSEQKLEVRTLETFFRSRVMIRLKAKPLLERGWLSESCFDAIRSALNELRVVEDQLGIMYRHRLLRESPLAPEAQETLHALVGTSPRLLIAPAHVSETPAGRLELKSGDVIVSRGNRALSAMIAKITGDTGVFSHAGVVYVDPVSKQTFTIESHVEIGTEVAPLQKYLTSTAGRVAVYRFRDAAVAQAAAKAIYEKARQASAAGHNIPYDFAMDTGSAQSLYCAETVRYAYWLGTGGSVEVPLYPSVFSLKNRRMFEQLGIHANAVFAPGDMDMDPRFEFIGEWRNFERVENSLLLGQILQKTYDWMDERGYEMHGTFGLKFKKYLAWLLRRVPLVKDWMSLTEKFPTNMSTSVLEVNFVVDKMSDEAFKPFLRRLYNQRLAEGSLLTRQEMMDALDQFRQEDYARWLRYKDWKRKVLQSPDPSREMRKRPELPLFHLVFSPKA